MSCQSFYEIFLMLTNKCNLNCLYCDHFCPVADDYWYISIEEVQDFCKIMKDKMPHLRTVFLFGGEPLLHPQVFEIAQLISEELPKVGVTISTNGTLINDKTVDSIMETLKEAPYQLYTPLYPPFAEQTLRMHNLMDENNVKLGMLELRNGFFQTVIDPKGGHKRDHDCGRVKQERMELHMYKNKIYNCAVASCMTHLGIPDDPHDYIDIYKLKDEEELYSFYDTCPNSCQYCQIEDGMTYVPWQISKKDKNEYLISLKELFLSDYEKYENIYAKDKFFKDIEKSDNLAVYNYDTFDQHITKHLQGKVNSKCDIFIPYNEQINNIDFNVFKEQIKNIEFYNFYFVSINAPRELEEKVYSSFIPFHLDLTNTWHLKDKTVQEYIADTEISFKIDKENH